MGASVYICAATAGLCIGCSGSERVHHALRQLEHGRGVATAAAGILLLDRGLHEGKQLGRGGLVGVRVRVRVGVGVRVRVRVRV